MTVTIDLDDLKEYNNYIEAKEELAKVSKGGTLYAESSFGDIFVRDERLKRARKKLRRALGRIVMKAIKDDL